MSISTVTQPPLRLPEATAAARCEPGMAGVSATVLIVDPVDATRTDLAIHARSSSFTAETASDVRETLAALARQRFDVIILDIRVGGLALLREILRRVPEALVALVTAHPTPAEAVEAMRAGASDYVAKPQAVRQVELLLRRLLAVRPQRPDREPQCLTPDLPYFLESTNPAMKRTLAMARQAAGADVPVLLTGEAGTGKHVLARAMHEWSAHRTGAFVIVACAALAEQSSTPPPPRSPGIKIAAPDPSSGTSTFRHEAGDGGTLFFSDVGDLPTEVQGQLLRSLDDRRFRWATGEDGEVNARVVVATTHDLEADVRSNRFREDLFFRLNVVITVPPLRDHIEDLPALTEHLLARLAVRHRRPLKRVVPETQKVFTRYRWPGNVLELFSVLERAVVLCVSDTITPADLPPRLLTPAPHATGESSSPVLPLHEVERRHIEFAISQCRTLEEAATLLGIDPATLWRKRKRWAAS